MKFRTEPALIIGFAQALLALAVSFGFDLSVEQVGALVAVTSAVMSLLLRQQVTPTSALPSPQPLPAPQPFTMEVAS